MELTATTHTYNVAFAAKKMIRITATDKAAAIIEAPRAMVRLAKTYNAKWSDQGLPTWALQSENHSDYVVTGARKLAR